MILEYILGKMAECMRDFIKKTKSMDMESIHGRTGKNIKDGGIQESSMDWAFSFLKREERKSLDSGKMARRSVGSPLKKYQPLRVIRIMISGIFSLISQS